jgi:hypothetical protein
MPVVDVDGGLNFSNYNPRILTGKLPAEQPIFYFGGSQVPANLNRQVGTVVGQVALKKIKIRLRKL